jgi:hypothetical protein
MEPPDSFFASLTEDGSEQVPVNLHLLTADAQGEGVPARTAESSFHRSRGYLCHDFHKPISRCLQVRRR